MNYNPYFPGGAIVMARVLYDGVVEYADGTFSLPPFLLLLLFLEPLIIAGLLKYVESQVHRQPPHKWPRMSSPSSRGLLSRSTMSVRRWVSRPSSSPDRSSSSASTSNDSSGLLSRIGNSVRYFPSPSHLIHSLSYELFANLTIYVTLVYTPPKAPKH